MTPMQWTAHHGAKHIGPPPLTKMSRPQISDHTRQEIIRRYRDGWSQARVSREVGVAPTTVARIFAKAKEAT